MQHQMARVIYKSKKGCTRDFKSLSWKLRLDLNNDNKMNIKIVANLWTFMLLKSGSHDFQSGPQNFHVGSLFGSLAIYQNYGSWRSMVLHVTLLWRDNDWSRVPSALIITITDQHKNWTQMDENTWIWINFYMYLWKKLSFIPSPKKSL